MDFLILLIMSKLNHSQSFSLYSIEMISDSVSDPAGAVHSGSVAEVHGVSAEGLQELPQTHHQGPHRVHH